MVVPGVAPDIEKLAPVMLVALIVMGTFPVLERVTLWDFVPCTTMLGNARTAGVNCQAGFALTVLAFTGTVRGEVVPLLAIEMVAFADVVMEDAVKLTVKFLLAFGASLRGAAIEPSEKPVPVREIAATSSSAVPVLEI